MLITEGQSARKLILNLNIIVVIKFSMLNGLQNNHDNRLMLLPSSKGVFCYYNLYSHTWDKYGFFLLTAALWLILRSAVPEKVVEPVHGQVCREFPSLLQQLLGYATK